MELKWANEQKVTRRVSWKGECLPSADELDGAIFSSFRATEWFLFPLLALLRTACVERVRSVGDSTQRARRRAAPFRQRNPASTCDSASRDATGAELAAFGCCLLHETQSAHLNNCKCPARRPLVVQRTAAHRSAPSAVSGLFRRETHQTR